jgi:hypothetical protein
MSRARIVIAIVSGTGRDDLQTPSIDYAREAD